MPVMTEPDVTKIVGSGQSVECGVYKYLGLPRRALRHWEAGFRGLGHTGESQHS